MSWFFNSDYESFLFTGRSRYQFNSSKLNQEFEYLIHFLEDEPIYTQKKYDHGYIERVQLLSGKEFLTEKDPEKAKAWWCPIGKRETDVKLHSKLSSTRLALKEGFEKEARIVSAENFEPKEGFLYKMPGELSGRGHLLWPKHAAKINSLVNDGHTLIEEPLRRRTRDFSSLILGPNEKIIYQNIVDNKFQYKGTILVPPSMTSAQAESYEGAISKISEYYISIGASFPFSIDSYLYLENGEEKLCAVSEVNARKTMGYVAYKLAQCFQAERGALLLSPSSNSIEEIPQAINLSPIGNLFQTIFIKEPDKTNLTNLVERITQVG